MVAIVKRIYRYEGRAFIATGRPADDLFDITGFVVCKGSRAKREVTAESLPDSTRLERQRLIRNGTLQDEGDYLVFTRDQVFRTRSAAACVVCGCSRSGRRNESWKVVDG